MKPICVPCQRFFRPKKNGFYFLEGMPVNNALPGKADPDNWKPYKLWAGDQWECPSCEAQIVVGFGQRPISEHYKEDFQKTVEQYGAEYQVNDC
jgi:hypothetical protein